MTDEITFFQDDSGQWRWHRKAPNGEIVSEGEAHTRRADAVRAAFRANRDNDWEEAGPA